MTARSAMPSPPSVEAAAEICSQAGIPVADGWNRELSGEDRARARRTGDGWPAPVADRGAGRGVEPQLVGRDAELSDVPRRLGSRIGGPKVACC